VILIKKTVFSPPSGTNKEQLNYIKKNLKDSKGRYLASKIDWLYLENFSSNSSEQYPVAITGRGEPLLLIHGFDSCFLEFRRLVPFLEKKYRLLIPDLYGFGFCPRPLNDNYGFEKIISHLTSLLNKLTDKESVGIIGASMGGTISMELARRNPKKINKMLLLSPAGLTESKTKIPWPINHIGVCFLKQGGVRKSLCRQSFADPQKSVGIEEEEIASIHLNVPGWGRSLASFAKNGGVANNKKPIPSQPTKIIWGKEDKIIKAPQRNKSMKYLGKALNELNECGHLPHLDRPKKIADEWLENF
tara:strand:+ start:6509 stop:7417 length:909 start_codon:yes stop_codon:yes gene_type:complete